MPRRSSNELFVVVRVLAALFAAAALPACQPRGGVVAVEVAESTADGTPAELAGSSSADQEKPAEILGLRHIIAARPRKAVRVGDLSVNLVQLGPGPSDAVETGEPLKPRPWTERLTAVVEIRNAGRDVETLWVEGNSPVVTDHKGHMRPPLDETDSINARGLAQDDSGLRRRDLLAPGGVVTVRQSFEIRTDDHGRPITLSYRVTPDTLVRWRLW